MRKPQFVLGVRFAAWGMVALLMFASGHACQAALVQYWTFDDGAGTTAANSVGGNTATLVPGGAGPTWVTTGLASPLTARGFMPSTAALSLNPGNPDFVNLGNI